MVLVRIDHPVLTVAYFVSYATIALTAAEPHRPAMTKRMVFTIM